VSYKANIFPVAGI